MLKEAARTRRSAAQVEALERSRSSSTATSITWSGSCGPPRSTISGCVRRWPTTCRTGRCACGISAELHTSGAARPIACLRDRNHAVSNRAGSAQPTSPSTPAPATSKSSSSGARIGVLLIVEDDGVGFDPSEAGRRSAGLRTARHAGTRRAGRRHPPDRVAPAGGTTILVRMPTPPAATVPSNMPDRTPRFASCSPTITSPSATGSSC